MDCILKLNPKWAFVVILLALVFSGLPAKAEKFVPGKIEVLVGGNGEKLIVVHAKPTDKNQALIKFENTGSDWDGTTIFHEVKEVDRGKYDYIAQIDGKPWRTLLVRQNNYGSSSMEVWVKGVKDPLNVSYSKKGTEAVRAEDIVNEYEKSIKK